MGTIYDLAKKTGFSITTVSKALNNYKDVNEKTRAKILKAAAEMDYLPNAHAQSLSTKKSWAIGVMFSEANEVGMKHPFFNGIIESFRHATEEQGYDLMFASRNLRNRDMSYLEHFKHRAVDGIVVICSDRMDEQVQELMQSDIPIVVVDMDSADCSVVYSDNIAGARLAVNHLYELGHRKIAHIAGDRTIDAGATRIKGYELAMQALDLPIEPGYLINAGFFSVEEGKQAMEKLLQLETPPTAVFVAGDQMAIGAIEAVHEHGLRVPEDISIIGYDDIDMIKYITPKLTTIRQDTDEIGEAAAELLIEQMTAKERLTERRVIPVKLIERLSCAPVKK
ncbi:LacI family transcriptional regulator [Exiguobacterium sp. SH3S2]|uniref:LacI family DNA-binding transcriptional regulator n=1 Tax=unclassified Exiguobacterium TaxID=2644629 RepID=UPI00103D0CCC|nr:MULTISPECIES: LacI family DNA-binding transcriptional regulator [unclassified Exiguobacterium]TCI24291.1 LacI family transcriptional regulator [Exiguobacterium sp. SH5S4]TCI42917.1 LacI family transcriptional regulator [Exiguobacterium sp. SH3S3]TCI56154.1 LacI family transcriptional regulator [Exiguobacterium sp. SH5S13]TCI58670.1 LacI family transcriptional regulator [Exiguobacterium sp. SH3S2]